MSEEPTFIKKATLTDDQFQRMWIEERNEEARAVGVTFMRASYNPANHREVIYEGWKVQPHDHGEIRWDAEERDGTESQEPEALQE